MRKFLMALAIGAIGAIVSTSVNEAKAQLVSTYKPAKDTLVNADTTVIALFPTNQAVSFHFKAEKVSGTVAGTATLQGSLDGVYWYNVGSAFTLTNIAHNQTIFEFTKLSWPKYRIQAMTSGTCKVNGIRCYDVRRG